MNTDAQSNKKAVVLLSGGLDSATCLASAKSLGFECYAISFQYGQRHIAEINAAKKLAKTLGAVEHITVPIGLGAIGGSALTDTNIDVPEEETGSGIPVTYVPARNTIFLSVAMGWAEVLQAQRIFIGVNAVDYSGYPDCRPEYISAFEKMANLATKSAIEGAQFSIETPLIHLKKSEIIQMGSRLGLDYSLTVSCYQADESGKACGACDSCRIRKQGFIDANLQDPTLYSG